MTAMASCECKESLVAIGSHMPPEQEQMYEQIQEIEKYENEAKDLQTFISDAQADHGQYIRSADYKKEDIEGHMNYHQNVMKGKLSLKPLVDPLRASANQLEKMVSDQKGYVKRYEERNKKLKDKLA